MINLVFSDQLWWAKARRKESKKLAELMLIPIYETKEWLPLLVVGVDIDRVKEVVELFQLEERVNRKDYKAVGLQFRRLRRWVESTNILNKE